MAQKKSQQQGPKKADIDTSNLHEQLEKQLDLDEQPHSNSGLNKVDEHMRGRSNNSRIEGGENEQRGEPTPGYSTVAPGHQNGGKR